MEQLSSEPCSSMVGEMTVRGGDPCLHGRRVGSRPQQFLIVVRLQHQKVASRERMTDASGRPSKIGGNANTGSAAGSRDCDGNRVYCVVHSGKGVHPELPDREVAARLIKPELLGSTEEWCTCLTCSVGEIDLSSEFTRKDTAAPGVVPVVMCDHYRCDGGRFDPQGVQSPLHLTGTEASVDEDSGRATCQDCCVPSASTA